MINYKDFIENEFMIVPLAGGASVPFIFNEVQNEYYETLKKDYPTMQGIRENVLKARQQGFSALIDAIFAVDFLLFENITGQIISHKDEETKALIQRVNFFLDCFLEKNKITRKQLLKTDSQRFLENRENGSELFIGTAGAKTLGRGDTLQNLHWSEVGYYPNTKILSAEKLVYGAEQQVATGVGKIFRESTGNVQGDYWHEEYKKSEKKRGSFKARFIPWFKTPRYRLEVEIFEPTPEEELIMQKHGLDKTQMNWYRRKIAEAESTRDGSRALGMKEYPTIPEEAFLAAGAGYFNADAVKFLYDTASKPVNKGNLAMDGKWV